MKNINSLFQTKKINSYDIQRLETESQTTTNQDNEYDLSEEIPFICTYDYLYHGIRFQKYLEKLESIFKDGKILAGNFIPNYYPYSDNCNKGEYVSLLKNLRDNIIEYDTFIESNISLLITPAVNAIVTKYIPYEEWNKIQKEKIPLKNLYSYLRGECLVKDYVSIDYVKAIGVPYQKLLFQNKKDYADKLIIDIQTLMEKYKIYLPIVDISRYNRILVNINKDKKRKKHMI